VTTIYKMLFWISRGFAYTLGAVFAIIAGALLACMEMCGTMSDWCENKLDLLKAKGATDEE